MLIRFERAVRCIPAVGLALGATVSIVAGSSPLVLAESIFKLDFTGLPGFSGIAGQTITAEYFCALTVLGDGPGAKGWSISFAAENARISRITIEGTEAEDASFKSSELTSGSGNEGAVSTVVLSPPETLQSNTFNEPHRIAKVELQMEIPKGGGAAFLRYVDGLKGSAEPVFNTVTEGNKLFKPTLGSFRIQLTDCSSHALNLAYTREIISSPVPFDRTLGVRGDGNEIIVGSRRGQKGATHVFGNIISQFDESRGGVQGWSLSLTLTGNASPTSATTAGTSVDKYFRGGFNKTEVIDPAKNGGLKGVVTAVVLAFTENRTLPPVGTESILDMGIEADLLQSNDDLHADLIPAISIRGADPGVENAATVSGNTEHFCNELAARAILTFQLLPPEFRRGNANDDSKVNIADAIWILNALFNQGARPTCQDAADTNNDGLVVISDAVYLIQYQFLGGPPPPAPYPECGLDPEGDDDGLSCAEAQVACP